MDFAVVGSIPPIFHPFAAAHFAERREEILLGGVLASSL